MSYTLISNSGIQLATYPLSISSQEKYCSWYHEWYDDASGCWRLDPVYELRTDAGSYYYPKKKLYDGGYLAAGQGAFSVEELRGDGIRPLSIDGEVCQGVSGEVYCLRLGDRRCDLSPLTDVWLPVPYFSAPSPRRHTFGPVNWCRMMLVPRRVCEETQDYALLLAFDTRTRAQGDEYAECPVFADRVTTEQSYSLCGNRLLGDEFLLMDYCTSGRQWSYINDYLFHLFHPTVRDVDGLKGDGHRLGYIATYTLLMKYLSERDVLPAVTLYRDTAVVVKEVDMVVDIGNSRTTALLLEDSSTFTSIRPLHLQDYTHPLRETDAGVTLRTYADPFDMRVVFRRVSFGRIGLKDSRQFVYPSFVRLGVEGASLLRAATSDKYDESTLSTFSSPKRYLWDVRALSEEWTFLVLPGEDDEHVLDLPGVSNNVKSDGRVAMDGAGGIAHHYSPCSLMTFAFLEMLVQARTQVNSDCHRSPETGLGSVSMPRKVRRIIVTCPTAMSKVEREALVRCAQDATLLLGSFDAGVVPQAVCDKIEVIPMCRSRRDDDATSWYYDEATCSQLVYMYGEVGYKYRGCCSEFFSLYGTRRDGASAPSITVGSLDIGAGTSDLMISRYTYDKAVLTTITPDPLFYDSYYYAGDDMLYGLIKNVMLFGSDSAFRRALSDKGNREYRQIMRDFFGRDYAGQTVADRVLRRDFNTQCSVPLMCHYLSLLSGGVTEMRVSYDDVFAESPVNESVLAGFARCTGIDLRHLVWSFDAKRVGDLVSREFEPLLRKIATIMYSYSCDIVLLSGRPASLPAIRNLFLRYYSVSPNRLIVLNNYYIGDWYPFGENTGYISNAKTIVAMGGLIAHYASELSNMNNFTIDLSKLKSNLHSTANYFASPGDGLPIDYFLTPEKHSGAIVVSAMPTSLTVRQIDIDSYPARMLYSLDFSRGAIGDRVRRKAYNAGSPLSESEVVLRVKEYCDRLRRRLPFTIAIDQDPADKEQLTIASVADRQGDDVDIHDIEIHIQSLGVDGHYWLDTGAFDF